MTSVLYRVVDSTPPVAVGGSGLHLVDAEGNRYLDACGGVAVSCLGHGHPRVLEAIVEQTRRLAYAHAGAFTTTAAEELADLLVGSSGGLRAAYFLSGGSEVVELCLKTAYQVHVERGEPGRTHVISRRQSYHGSTIATLAISGNVQRRSVLDPILPPSQFVSPCYAYRDRLDGETDGQYAARLAAELDDTIRRLGPHRVSCFVAETVVGSTSGAVPPVDGYFRAVREVCDRHGVLLVLDEVMAGMGRTGHRFAYLEDGVLPDIVAVGKGLAAGYQPLSAMLVSGPVHDAIRRGSGILRNGQTFVNHSIACAAGLAVQRTIDDDDLLPAVRARGARLTERLRGIGSPYAGDVRGRGLFVGLELVADRATKEPWPVAYGLAAKVKAAALREGLMVYPMSGTIDGTRGDHVLFAPPFLVTDADVDEIAGRFAVALDKAVTP